MIKQPNLAVPLKDTRLDIPIIDDSTDEVIRVLKFQPKDMFVGEMIARFNNLDKDVQKDIKVRDIDSLNKELSELYESLAKAKDDTADDIVEKIAQKKHEILDAEFNNDGVLPYTERVAKYVNMIFGDGAAEFISHYDGLTGDLMTGIMESVRRGYDYYAEETKKQAKADRLKAIADARKEASAFSVPK